MMRRKMRVAHHVARPFDQLGHEPLTALGRDDLVGVRDEDGADDEQIGDGVEEHGRADAPQAHQHRPDARAQRARHGELQRVQTHGFDELRAGHERRHEGLPRGHLKPAGDAAEEHQARRCATR